MSSPNENPGEKDDSNKPKITFSLGAHAKKSVELQLKEEKPEKNFITGITKSGAIIGGKDESEEPSLSPYQKPTLKRRRN